MNYSFVFQMRREKKLKYKHIANAQFSIIRMYRLSNFYYIADLSELNDEKALSHDV